MKNETRAPSPMELEVAQRIKEVWDRKRKDLKLTQEKAAAMAGWTQGMFSNYINGGKPIGVKAAIQLSLILQESVLELAPEIIGDLAPAFSANGDMIRKQTAYNNASDNARVLADEALIMSESDVMALMSIIGNARAVRSSIKAIAREGLGWPGNNAGQVQDSKPDNVHQLYKMEVLQGEEGENAFLRRYRKLKPVHQEALLVILEGLVNPD